MAYDPKKINGKNHRDLESLHPKVAQLAQIFIKNSNSYLAEKGYSCKVISTLRTWQEQQEIYNQGRTTTGKIVTNAKPGDSIHNWGCAFDVGIFKDGVYNPSGSEKLLAEIAPLAKKIGLSWGGDWISIKDYPHFQYTGKLNNNEFLKQAKAGKSIDELLGE